MQDLVYNPGKSLLELVSVETAKRLPLFVQDISQTVRRNIKNPKLRSILEFPVLFLGAKPSDTPAFYNFMNHADFGLGTWYPRGGFNAVAKGIARLAEDLGVKFLLNEEITEIVNEDRFATRIISKNGQYEADIFISGADYAHTESLLNKEVRNYSSEYWNKKTFAPSSLLYYVAFDRKVPELQHHNLFFDEDFDAHASDIYKDPKWPNKPLFYASCPSKTDPSVAPPGGENLFLLIPIAPNLKDSEKKRDEYFEILKKRLIEKIGFDINPHIVYKRSYCISDFVKDYNAFKGNAYGLANTLKQTALLKPRIKNKHLSNLFYTGQLTVPGPGVPPSIVSGEVVAKHVIKRIEKLS